MYHTFLQKKSILLLSLLLLGCVENPQDKDIADSELIKKVDEMQKELRLVLKEVVALQKKVDALSQTKEPRSEGSNTVKSIELSNNERLIGSADAEYAIIEFMDYQCPYCIRHAKQVLPVIKERYIDTGTLRYGIRDFPLDFHRKAEAAAVAANCAGKQGKYWQFHDDLVLNSRKLSSTLYSDLADKYDLDKVAYSECQNDPQSKLNVSADLAYGKKMGTRGTPNFFIGKIDGDTIVDVIQMSGARSVEAFDRAIQRVISAE